MSTSDRSGRPMMSQEPPEELRHVLETRVRSESVTAECLDEEVIAALAAGTLAREIRASVLPHVASCARCRSAVASVARALADAEVVREVAVAERGGRGRLYRLAVPAAAAAALVLLLAWPREANDRSGHRGGDGSSGRVVPVPVAPVGAVATAGTLLWSSVAGADRYRATLFAADGRVLYETQLPDTQATLPDSVRLTAGRSYLWKVEARTGFDRWAASELVEFSIATAPSR